MTLPTIHNNGDRAQTLCDDYCAARSAILTAMEALSKCYPNGRNYYPQGPQAIESAMTEHRDRQQRLNSVADELQTLAMYCADQIKP